MLGCNCCCCCFWFSLHSCCWSFLSFGAHFSNTSTTMRSVYGAVAIIVIGQQLKNTKNNFSLNLHCKYKSRTNDLYVLYRRIYAKHTMRSFAMYCWVCTLFKLDYTIEIASFFILKAIFKCDTFSVSFNVYSMCVYFFTFLCTFLVFVYCMLSVQKCSFSYVYIKLCFFTLHQRDWEMNASKKHSEEKNRFRYKCEWVKKRENRKDAVFLTAIYSHEWVMCIEIYSKTHLIHAW